MATFIILDSPSPLKNTMLPINITCLICFIIVCGILFVSPIGFENGMGYGVLCILGLIVLLLGMIYIYWNVLEFKLKQIRNIHFKFKENVISADLFRDINQILKNDYKMDVIFKNNKIIIVMYKKHSFEIMPCMDNTFCIWWRRTENEKLLLKNRYRSYRVVREATAIIAYEIQNLLEISKKSS